MKVLLPANSSPLISSLLRIHPRFMRSVHLERDITDPASSLGYILTPVARQALARIAAGFRVNSTQRAWRISGDYGSGKTDLGLVLARLAHGATRELPRGFPDFGIRNTFLPVIATGDREPLGLTILRALGQTWGGRRARPTTEEILRAVHESITKARRRQFAGVLLIVDELGKNLEYAARHPEADDVFLLQRLAEEASRSGEKGFVMVVMLHQGVSAYAVGLDSAAKKEWDKIAGRFEEIVYTQPIEQTATLVAATLNVDLTRLPQAWRDRSREAMADALRQGLYGSSAPVSLADLGARIFPIHPATLPVLVRTLRRFGQNERSLFGFISSFEPMALQQHIEQPINATGYYRIHHLFDYVRLNLLPAITAGNSYTHWGVIEAVLASTSIQTPEEEAVLKTVALLSLLDAPDLPATETIVASAVGGVKTAVAAAIETLRARGVIYERGTVKGLCLWPHTSVNLDELFTKALTATSSQGDAIKRLCDHVRCEDVVPRGYYAENGTLRYGSVALVPASELEDLLGNPPQLDGRGADIHLRVILPADRAQQRAVKRILHECHPTILKGLFIAVTEPPDLAVAALADLLAWEWIKENTPHLSGDRFAREEVSRQWQHAQRNLRLRLGGLDNLALPMDKLLPWYHRGAPDPESFSTGRKFLEFLGLQCARIYEDAPEIFNELINRRTPSSAAVGARTKLSAAMATAASQPKLGLDDTKRPPEMALYLSILEKGGFHVETESGWVFRLPSPERDVCRLLPSLNLMTEKLKAKGLDALVPVPEILAALSIPPYGVREGLQLFILAIYLATHHQRVALYEDGTYLHRVGGSVYARIMKEPECFHLQYCELDVVRAEVLDQLLHLLEIDPRDASQTDLLDLVRPLVVFVAQEIPEYSRKTNRLSAAAVEVRRALLEEREPIKLVFTTLPVACGLPPIGSEGLNAPDELGAHLRTALHEIRTAYPNLIERLRNAIFAAFDVAEHTTQGRIVIADRASQLAVTVTEPALNALARRLGDPILSERSWVESVANLLARKSPERWLDKDETEFHHQLEIAAGRFKRTEMAVIGTTKKLNGHACRIALTKSDGTEVRDLVHWEGMDESRIRPVEMAIAEILHKHGRNGMAAAMRAIWAELDRGQEAVQKS